VKNMRQRVYLPADPGIDGAQLSALIFEMMSPAAVNASKKFASADPTESL
jgi:hypothetical protein